MRAALPRKDVPACQGRTADGLLPADLARPSEQDSVLGSW